MLAFRNFFRYIDFLITKFLQWLSMQMNAVSSLGVFGANCRANHVLINEYLPGQGIMAHVDGPSFSPTITTLNLGAQILLNLYCEDDKDNPEVNIP